MSSKICKNCGKVLDSSVDICTFCGARIDKKTEDSSSFDFEYASVHSEKESNKKNSYINNDCYVYDTDDSKNNEQSYKTKDRQHYIKMAFIAGMAVLIIGGGLFCVMSLMRSNQLKGEAEDSLSSSTVKLSTQCRKGRNSILGNLPENVNSGGYVLFDNNQTYIADKDTISKIDINSNINETKKTVCNVEACALNVHDSNLFFICKSKNCLCFLKDFSNASEAQCNLVFSAPNNLTLCNLCIYKDYMFLLAKSDVEYKIYLLDATNNGLDLEFDSNDDYSSNTKMPNNYKFEEIFSAKAKQAWLGQSDGTVKLCCSLGTNWTIYENYPDNDLTLFNKKLSGNSSINDVQFLDNKVIVFDDNFVNKSGNACLYEYQGGRQEYHLNLKPIKDTASSGNAVIVATEDNYLAWFDYNVGFIHDIAPNQDVDSQSHSILNIGFSQGKVCVVYDCFTQAIDINNGNQYIFM